jgi:hypothetical protein
VIPDQELPGGGAEEEEHRRRIREHQVIVLDNNSLASHNNIGDLEIIEEEEDILYTEESPLESLERPSSLFEGTRPRRRRASSLRDMRRNEHR